MKNQPEALKAAMAARMRAALAEHPDLAVRRWAFRDVARAVAEESGVAVADDSARTWMEGSQPRDPRVAAALARVLNVPAGWLYFGEIPDPTAALPATALGQDDIDRTKPAGKVRRHVVTPESEAAKKKGRRGA